MEAGPSQAATMAQGPPHELPKKERKPRHKLKKGKEREENAIKEDTGLSKVTLDKGPVTEASAWAWASLAETPVSNRPPVFTRDYRYFFLIAGSSVKIYATATGQVVSTLSCSSSGSTSSSSQLADGHTDDITAALVNPRNAFQLMTASLDGRIKVWDYLEAALLSTIEIGEPITHMCAHEHVLGHVFVATSPQKKNASKDPKERSKVYRVSLRPSRASAENPIHKPAEVLKVGKMRATTGLAISPSGAWLVATGGPKAYVCSTTSLGSGFTKFVSTELLTCLAFHPSEEYFATGDLKGQIRLWYCLDPAQIPSRSQGENRPLTTTLHWHAHAVSSIAFTPNGSYLLSGGEESVLVIWQLHTGKREFVPRVGAPIVSIAVASHQSSDEEYLLLLSDGTISFVGSDTLHVSRTFSRIKHDPNYRSSGLAPLAVHTQTSTVILPSSHPSSLLIYAPLTSTLIAELEVSPSNRISRRDEKPIEPPRVDRVVISSDGQWLATIDGRGGSEDFERETYMKIWQWDPTSSSWALNSRVDRPHGIHRVNALTFAPVGERPFLVSAGGDGRVKVWRVTSITNEKRGQEEVFWVCRSTTVYRSKVPTDAVCSPDGSLLAVAYGGHVVVYELSNNVTRVVLTCPELKEILHVSFVGKSGRYIAVANLRAVVLWDLVTTNIQWQHMVPHTIKHIVSHPEDETFVVMCDRTLSLSTVLKFNVTSDTIVSSRTLPFQLREVVWYPYMASGNDYTLVGITEKWSSVILGDRVNLPQDEGSSAREISGDSAPHRRNLFHDIFGISAFQNIPSEPVFTIPSIREDAFTGPSKSNRPLDTAAYLLPPLHTMFKSLVESLLQKRDTQSSVLAKDENQQVEEEDAVMEDVSPSNNGAGRVLLHTEMDEFVELFKQQTFASPLNATLVPKFTSNLNGNYTTKVTNGSHHHKASSTPASVNGRNHAPKRQAEHAQESSPTIVGKKRKKSMG